MRLVLVGPMELHKPELRAVILLLVHRKWPAPTSRPVIAGRRSSQRDRVRRDNETRFRVQPLSFVSRYHSNTTYNRGPCNLQPRASLLARPRTCATGDRPPLTRADLSQARRGPDSQP